MMDVIAEKSIGLDGKVFPERRESPRRRVLRSATVCFNSGYSTFECVVRNEGATGAMLSFGETFALPSEFQLLVAPDSRSRHARVRWRTMSHVGVSLD